MIVRQLKKRELKDKKKGIKNDIGRNIELRLLLVTKSNC